MFKRIPDKRLNKVSGGARPICKCLCVDLCACDAMLGDDAASYAVMVPQATTTTYTAARRPGGGR